MKKLLRVVLMTVLTGLAFSGAASGGDIKIGVIDTQKIMMESKAAERARVIFLKEVESKRSLLISSQEEVSGLEKEIRKTGKNMSSQERKEMSDDLARKIKDLRRLRDDLEEELKRKDMEWRRKIIQDVSEIVKEFQKKEKYTIILEKNSLVASDETIDITDKIIRLYDFIK